MAQGNIVYSPLSGSHRIAHHMDNRLDHDFWLNQCMAFIDWADEMVVMDIPGARQSRGIAREIEHAQERGIPVRWITT